MRTFSPVDQSYTLLVAVTQLEFRWGLWRQETKDMDHRMTLFA